MKDILQYIISLIVQKPEAVKIEEEEKDGILQYSITADPSDIGKIIGKEGKIIRSIRNVMKIPAIKEGKRINVSLADTTPQAEE
jgi:predicted RNA-binding protein YlqC (UPF0109 family)